MKKGIFVVIALVGAVLGAFFVIRSMEPREVALPPAAPIVPAASAPVEAQPAAQSAPTVTAPVAAPKPEIPADLADLLKSVGSFWPAPTPASIRESCAANPRLAAEKFGMIVPEQNSWGPQMAAVLCSRDLGACDQADALSAEVGSCPEEPCLARTVPLYSSEAMEAGSRGCRTWASWLLFTAQSLEGGRDNKTCRNFLPSAMGGKISDGEVETLCTALGADILSGADGFCKEVASKPYGGMNIPYRECTPMEAFIKGSGKCSAKAQAGKPSCALLAKTRSALMAKDPGACQDDPLCLAFFSPGRCEAGRFEDFRNPGWAKICNAAVSKTLLVWVENVTTAGPAAHDRLVAYRDRMKDIPSERRAHVSGLLEAAISDTDKAIKEMETLRRRMNKGGVLETATPSEEKPVKKARKGRKRRA